MKNLAIGLLVLIVVLVGGLLLSPYGPLVGGALEGDVHQGTVEDWSFVTANRFCKFEVSQPEPRSFTVTCLSVDGELYLGCMRCTSKSWPSDLDQYPEARYRAEDLIYEVTATRLDSLEDRQRIWDARRAVDGGDITEVPDDYWIYRLVSR